MKQYIAVLVDIHKHCCLLRCDAVNCGKSLRMFQRISLPPSSLCTMMMEAALPSATSLHFYHTTYFHMPEDSNFETHHIFLFPNI